jgi:predicted DNA-binding protein
MTRRLLYCLLQQSGVRWCNAEENKGLSMPAAKRKVQKTKASQSSRTSVTFPPDLYQTLEDMAKRKKVSVAWIVRDAAEKYVADQWPLFASRQ